MLYLGIWVIFVIIAIVVSGFLTDNESDKIGRLLRSSNGYWIIFILFGFIFVPLVILYYLVTFTYDLFCVLLKK